jgi:hypothetical protein
MRSTAMKLIVIAVAVVVLGCQRVPPPVLGRQDPYAEHQVHFANDELRTQTALGAAIVTRDPQSQLLYVQVPIRNTTDHTLRIDYRISFYDANGTELWQTGWFDQVLAPNVPDRLTANSPDSRAAAFRVDIRRAQ